LTPVCQFVFARDFSRFLEVNNMTYDTEAGAAWLMLDAIDRAEANVVPHVPNDREDLTCALQPEAGSAGAAANAVTYLAANTAADRVLAQGIPRAAFTSLLADRQKALFWLLNLTACHQVKPMRAQNIANWFRMTSRVTISGRTVLRVLDFGAVTLPNIMTNDQLRGLLSTNKFMEYHTAFSSTAQLAQEMLEVCPQVTNHIFSEASRAAVRLSFADKTNAVLNTNISQQVVLATYAYLSVFNKLPDGWFQGEKALASLPANRYQLYVAIFKRVKTLTVASEELTEAETIEGLVAALGAGLQNI